MQWTPQSQEEHPPQTQQILTELLAKIANKLLDFRCDHKGEQPTSVRHIATWNVGGWTQPGRAGDDKLKAIKASLHKGPIALQETHWTHEQVLRSSCQLVMRSSHTKLYYQDKS